MKYMCLIGDGMADFPLEDQGGRTPLELASTPALDTLAREGLAGLFCPIPDDLPPGSDIGNLSLFGYDPHATFTGRAPLEAANQGITLSADQVAFRCNLVTLEDGAMRSFTSGHISSEEAAQLIEALNAGLADGALRFHPGVSYRHLAVVTEGAVSADALTATACTPPHDISDRPYAPHLPAGAAGDFLNDLMRRSVPLLDGHPVNRARIDRGKPPATSIWLWGQGKAPTMETYAARFGLTGAVISAVDLVRGIGVCAGLESLRVPGATGYLDTNYEGKVSAAFDALERHDFVYLHVEAPDETSHEGRADLKVRAIEDFDARVVAPCLAHARERGDLRILAAPDHITAISTKTHAGGPVPFAVWGPGVSGNGAAAYTERAAAATGVLVSAGHRVVEAVLRNAALDAHSLQ